MTPTAASGQSLPSDPEADSPSGVVYELPVDRARKDAAPHRSASGKADTGSANSGGPSSGGSCDGSAVGGVSAGSIRSENNFGTSSNVPGAPQKKKGKGNGTGATGSDSGGSANGGGSGSGSGGSTVDRLANVAGSSTAQGPSDGVVFPLLAVLLAVGAGIGVVAGRRSLRGRRS
jgi:hypothetical protein